MKFLSKKHTKDSVPLGSHRLATNLPLPAKTPQGNDRPTNNEPPISVWDLTKSPRHWSVPNGSGPLHQSKSLAPWVGFIWQNSPKSFSVPPCLREIPDIFERAVRRKVDFGRLCERWFDEVYGEPLGAISSSAPWPHRIDCEHTTEPMIVDEHEW